MTKNKLYKAERQTQHLLTCQASIMQKRVFVALSNLFRKKRKKKMKKRREKRPVYSPTTELTSSYEGPPHSSTPDRLLFTFFGVIASELTNRTERGECACVTASSRDGSTGRKML